MGRRLLLGGPDPAAKITWTRWPGVYTAGVFFTPTALCTPPGRFYKHPLGSLGIKGIRVINVFLRLQLQHQRNP